MRKILISLLLSVFLVFYSFAQNKDSDGDGISDEQESDFSTQYPSTSKLFFNPLIADIPSISIVPYGEVKIGFLYKYTDEQTLTSKSIEKTGTVQENTTKETKYNSNSVKKEFEANMKAGFKSSGISNSYSFETNVSASLKLDAESGIKFSDEKINSFKKEYENLQQQVNESKISLGEKAGYIVTKFMVYNPHPFHTVKIKNIRYKIYSFNIKTGKVNPIPFMGDNVLYDNSELILKSNQSDDIYVEISYIKTKKIIDLLDNNESIIFEIKDYDFTVVNPNNDTDLVKYSQIQTSVRLKTIPIRIIDSISDITYYVSKKIEQNKPLTVNNALKLIVDDSTSYNVQNTSNDRFKINKLNDITSSLDISNLKNLSDEALRTGQWFSFYTGKHYDGKYNSSLDCADCSVTFIYFTAKDILNEKKIIEIDTTAKIENLLISSKNPQDAYDTKIKLKSAYKLHFEFKSEVQVWTQNWSDLTQHFACSGGNYAQNFIQERVVSYKQGSSNLDWKFFKTSPYFGDFGIYMIINSIKYNISDFPLSNIQYSPDNVVSFDLTIDEKLLYSNPILYLGSSLYSLKKDVFKLIIGNTSISTSQTCVCNCPDVGDYISGLGLAVPVDFIGHRNTTINIYEIKNN